MDFPVKQIPPRYINTFTRYCRKFDVEAASQGGASMPTSAAWPSANLALYFPVVIPFNFNIKRFFVYNGSTANGNVDVGIYTSEGTKIASSGSTAQSGTNDLQFFTGFDVLLTPGAYYLALALSSATGTVFRFAESAAITGRLSGYLQEASAVPLPAVMTPAQYTNGYVPIFGMTSNESGL